jgi:hypothetical protein
MCRDEGCDARLIDPMIAGVLRGSLGSQNFDGGVSGAAAAIGLSRSLPALPLVPYPAVNPPYHPAEMAAPCQAQGGWDHPPPG